MARGRLHLITKLVTRDVFETVIKSSKPRTRRKLPGRRLIYVWDESFKRDLEADLDVPGFIVRVEVNCKDCEYPSIDGEAGEEDGEVVIWLNIHYNPCNIRHRSALYQELAGVIRHELEHLSQIGPLMMQGPAQQRRYGHGLPESGKMLHDINRRRKLFGMCGFNHDSWAVIESDINLRSAAGCFKSYIMSHDELGPFVVGFMRQSILSQLPFEQVATDYLDYFVNQRGLPAIDRNQALEWLMIWAADKYPHIKLRGNNLHN